MPLKAHGSGPNIGKLLSFDSGPNIGKLMNDCCCAVPAACPDAPPLELTYQVVSFGSGITNIKSFPSGLCITNANTVLNPWDGVLNWTGTPFSCSWDNSPGIDSWEGNAMQAASLILQPSVRWVLTLFPDFGNPFSVCTFFKTSGDTPVGTYTSDPLNLCIQPTTLGII